MKPGYKIIITGVLIYAGFQAKKMIDISPYKERASRFVVLLKQNKPFKAQEMLTDRLQSDVSIEQLHAMSLEQNLSGSREIDWSDWDQGEEKYTLHGEIIFRDANQIPVSFTLSSRMGKLMIDSFSIGRVDFYAKDQNSTGFLE